jgi:enoyl-CoA hydratase/carnithine racemase
MDSVPLIIERRGGALWLTINRPDQRNAMTDPVIHAIRSGLRQAQADAEVRVIVLTGAGDEAFCVGADLEATSNAFQADASGSGTAFGGLLRDMRLSGKPLIARVNGHCMAGGMGLLGMCDLGVAASGALFGLPEVKVGVFPMQVFTVLRDIVSPRKLREFSLTGEHFDAAEALAAGLVNYVVEPADLDVKIDWLIGRLANKSPTAQQRGRRAIAAAADLAFDEALRLMEREIVALGTTDDAIEGRRAFAEKRKPKWTRN